MCGFIKNIFKTCLFKNQGGAEAHCSGIRPEPFIALNHSKIFFISFYEGVVENVGN